MEIAKSWMKSCTKTEHIDARKKKRFNVISEFIFSVQCLIQLLSISVNGKDINLIDKCINHELG